MLFLHAARYFVLVCNFCSSVCVCCSLVFIFVFFKNSLQNMHAFSPYYIYLFGKKMDGFSASSSISLWLFLSQLAFTWKHFEKCPSWNASPALCLAHGLKLMPHTSYFLQNLEFPVLVLYFEPWHQWEIQITMWIPGLSFNVADRSRIGYSEKTSGVACWQSYMIMGIFSRSCM